MTDRQLPKNARMVPKEAKLAFKGEIFDVYQWQQEMYDKSFATFEMLKRPDTAVVIAIDDGQIVLLDEQQPDGTADSNHLPSGRIEPSDESVLAGAQRELEEETGLQFAKWALLEVTQPVVKIEWFVHVFVATDKIGQVPTRHDAGEKIIVKHGSFDDLKKSASKSGIESLRQTASLDELLEKVGLT